MGWRCWVRYSRLASSVIRKAFTFGPESQEPRPLNALWLVPLPRDRPPLRPGRWPLAPPGPSGPGYAQRPARPALAKDAGCLVIKLNQRERGLSYVASAHQASPGAPWQPPPRGQPRSASSWSESQRVAVYGDLARSLAQAGFRKLKIIRRNPTRPPKSRWKLDPPPLGEDSTGWLAPSPRQSSACFKSL